MKKSLWKSDLNILNLPAVYKYKRDYRLAHPDELTVTGVTVFCGSQGSGKTYNAVRYVHMLAAQFPKSILCTNIDLDSSFFPSGYQIIRYESVDSLYRVRNGEYGVIFLIDEMHLEFNSLKSKDMPEMLFAEISQQRKQRVHIVGTSQVYTRLAKPFREQIDTIVACRTFLGAISWLEIIDGATVKETTTGISCNVVKRCLVIHNVMYYFIYNTYQKIFAINDKGGVVHG